MKAKTNKAGISLIVLTITIIVMIILAGTIIISLNNSGIIGKASEAVGSQNLATEKQRLELIKGEILAKNAGEITVEEYIAKLQSENVIESTVTTNADGSKSVVTKSGYAVKIEQSGTNVKVTFEGESGELAVIIDEVTLTTGTNNIIVTITLEQGSGVEYTYYYRVQDSGEEYIASNEEKTTNSTYTITGLDQTTTYEIKVEATNVYGTSEGYATGRTGTVTAAQGNVTLKSITWTNGKANITVEKAASVDSTQTMEYSIDDGANYLETTGNITEIESGTTVLIRLTDGRNHGSTASIEVVDGTAPEATLAVGTATETTIPVTVTATDSETGIKEYRYYIKKSTETSYTLQETLTTGTYTYEGLESGTEYDIKIEVEDNAENTTPVTSTKVATVESNNEEEIDNGTYDEIAKDANGMLTANATYISNGYTAVIPKGYAISSVTSEQSIATGLVIKDANGNEFVWIPVTTDLASSYSYLSSYSEPKELAVIWSDSTLATKPRYDSQGILDELYGKNYYTYSKYAEEYAEMVEKVNQYDGFYIGRYETTIDSDGNIGSKYNTEVLTAGTTLFTKDSVNYPYRWYGLYQAGKNANVTGNGTDVQTAMIYGVLYDKVMQFIREQKAAGNTTYDVSSRTSTWHGLANGHSRVVNSAQANAGDVALNIWDLASNAHEWTQEAYSANNRVARGGAYNTNYGGEAAARIHGDACIPTNDGTKSTRLALYLQ